MVMPRVGVPPYPIAGGVDDLDEDTPPIIPQFPCEQGRCGGTLAACAPRSPDVFSVSPAASMMRPPLTRSSSLCRSRRSLLTSPQSALISADPDLLSMAGSSHAYRPEADGEHVLFGSDRRGYVAVAEGAGPRRVAGSRW